MQTYLVSSGDSKTSPRNPQPWFVALITEAVSQENSRDLADHISHPLIHLQDVFVLLLERLSLADGT